MRKTWLLIPILVLAFTACTRAVQTPTDPQVLIELDIGDEFEIVLESELSPGYHWEIVGGLDGKKVDLLNRYYQSGSDPGRAGVEIFLFRAVGGGETVITLGYYSPGTAAELQQTRTFTVDVDVD